MQTKQFTITKKIAKHGEQGVIVIPSILKDYLKPQSLVRVMIEVIEDK